MEKYPPIIKLGTDRLDEKWTEANTPNQGRRTVFGKRGMNLEHGVDFRSSAMDRK